MSIEPSSKSDVIDSTIHIVSTACFILFVFASNFSISLTQAGAYIGITLWLIQTHRSGTWKKNQTTLLWPFVLYLAATLVSIAWAVDPGVSASQLKKFSSVLIFFWTINMLGQSDLPGLFSWLGNRLSFLKRLSNWIHQKTSFPSGSPLEILVTLLFVSAMISAFYGLFQAFIHGGGLDDRTEIRGTMGHVFTFSAMLMMIGLLIFSRQLFNQAQRKWVNFALLALFLCLILTMVRQVWLSLFITISFLMFLKRKVLVAVPVLLGVLIFLFSPQTIQNRITSITDFDQYSNNIRFQMWEGGIDVIKDYPLTGCGYKCLYLIHDQYPQHPVLQEFYYNLHNNLIQIAVDSGLLGLSAWLGIWVSYFITLVRRYKKNRPGSPPRWVFMGSAAAVASFLIAGLFETNFYDSEVVMVLYFIMALPFVSGPALNPQSAVNTPSK